MRLLRPSPTMHFVCINFRTTISLLTWHRLIDCSMVSLLLLLLLLPALSSQTRWRRAHPIKLQWIRGDSAGRNRQRFVGIRLQLAATNEPFFLSLFVLLVVCTVRSCSAAFYKPRSLRVCGGGAIKPFRGREIVPNLNSKRNALAFTNCGDIKKLKKNILKVIFQVEGVVTQKKL